MMNPYQNYIALSKYARWDDKLKRRETWDETVKRYGEFFWGRIPDDELEKSKQEFAEALGAIRRMEVMPSMRCLMTAGKALARDNVAGYNCSYLPIDHPRAFDELMYILLCGTGVGYSVERQYVNKLPDIAEVLHDSESTIRVADSKIGWASAFRELLALLYAGEVPKWDLSKVRPKGARLKTFGGRASGPGPLDNLFRRTVQLFKGAVGRKLNSLECHDVCCYVADTVVSGGVRRSACICLSNLSDDRMRQAKTGQWQTDNPQRGLCNNSVAYTERPDFEVFFKELRNLHRSKSGERGIINRTAFKRKAESIGRDSNHEFGANPCGEIILRPNQFCNLSEVVVRPTDTLDDLRRKVRLATILGTVQATLTDFRYLRKVWETNTKEEALLGVSLTGIMDHPVMTGKDRKLVYHGDMWFLNNTDDLVNAPHNLEQVLQNLKQVAKETNEEWAAKLGINKAQAITCVKPSGTVSQLVDSSSGIHPRLYKYYIRTVISDKTDALAKVLITSGVPYDEDDKHYYFKFPMESPSHSVCKSDLTAMEQLKLWKTYQDYWCDHNPSQTIYYKDEDFLHIGAWVWDNFGTIGGLSFFPESDHVYEHAPYREISGDEYMELAKSFPRIAYERLSEFEMEDQTTSSQEFSCHGGACEL